MDKPKDKKYNIQSTLAETLAGDVMSTPALTLDRKDDFSRAEEVFVHRYIRHLPVVDANKKLIGIISKRDLFRTVSPRKLIGSDVTQSKDVIIDKPGIYYIKETLDSFILDKVMVKDVKTVTKNQSIVDVINIMVDKKVGCVPVVTKSNTVCGMITRYDILRIVNQFLQAPS